MSTEPTTRTCSPRRSPSAPAGRTTAPSLAPVLWATSTFVTPDARRGPPHGDRRPRRPLLQPLRQPDRERPSRTRSPQLEGAEAALAFASGMGAVAQRDPRRSARPATTSSPSASSTPARSCSCRAACARFGIDVTFVDGTEPGAFAAAVRPGRTMLVVAETPANPQLDLVDLDELGAITGPDHRRRLDLRHAARPAAARPRRRPRAALGDQGDRRPQRRHARRGRRRARSCSTALGLRGAARRERVAVRRASTACAASARCRCASRRQSDDGAAPGRASSSGIRRWRRCATRGSRRTPSTTWPSGRWRCGGSLLAFDARRRPRGRPALRRGACELAQLASSLGGPETLVTHPANPPTSNLTPEELAAAGIGPGLVRVSVGLEHADDLIADFHQALSAFAGVEGVHDLGGLHGFGSVAAEAEPDEPVFHEVWEARTFGLMIVARQEGPSGHDAPGRHRGDASGRLPRGELLRALGVRRWSRRWSQPGCSPGRRSTGAPTDRRRSSRPLTSTTSPASSGDCSGRTTVAGGTDGPVRAPATG